jgi:hypothetical protein
LNKTGAARPAAGRPAIPILSGVRIGGGAVKGALASLAVFAALDCPFIVGEWGFSGE